MSHYLKSEFTNFFEITLDAYNVDDANEYERLKQCRPDISETCERAIQAASLSQRLSQNRAEAPPTSILQARRAPNMSFHSESGVPTQHSSLRTSISH
jgi:hypothetical protein